MLSEMSQQQKEVLLAEIKSDSFLVRTWRPMVALSMSFVFLFYALIMPVMVAWGNFSPVKVGDLLLEWVFHIITLCLGGYIVGRTVEKVVSAGWGK